ncbi:MAG TPA: TlpA disulfide reductase family protein [Usitatibacter sp.]|nr:TlpA disulfide reductase family protein [Usitatibacter sp.]
MKVRWLFAGIALLAFLAGLSLWLANEPALPKPGSADLAPAALYAATFRDAGGQPLSLARFEGRVLVLNFWATWCAPCRREMPGFARLQSRWSSRGVQFVGVANDDPAKVASFGRELGIGYPLLTGGDEVDELARRLGDRDGSLPFTVVLDPQGQVLEQRIGAYPEDALEAALQRFVH